MNETIMGIAIEAVITGKIAAFLLNALLPRLKEKGKGKDDDSGIF
jgi:hypothetical protein